VATSKINVNARAALTAQFLNGILYAVGGTNNEAKSLTTNEAYNPATDT
jgi:hypothetical protein